MKEKKVKQILEEVADEMCREFCRWPLVYKPDKFTDKDYMQELLYERCEKCPLRRLL